jgi:hypothetical protein
MVVQSLRFTEETRYAMTGRARKPKEITAEDAPASGSTVRPKGMSVNAH